MFEDVLEDSYISVTDGVYDPGITDTTPIYDIKQNVIDAFQTFYHSHVEGSLQIFHSLTLGEILIAVLLALILLVFVFKWIWEVVRYG